MIRYHGEIPEMGDLSHGLTRQSTDIISISQPVKSRSKCKVAWRTGHPGVTSMLRSLAIFGHPPFQVDAEKSENMFSEDIPMF